MKKFTLLTLLTFSSFVFSQNEDLEHQQMREAEMKSASNLMNLAVNPNTLNYDLTYQKLEFTVDPAILYVSGKVTSTFTAISAMNSVTFDLYKKTTAPFTISSVKVNNVVAPFSYNSTHELVITLPTTLTTGNTASTEIIYEGIPSIGQSAFSIGTHSGSPVLWTLSEPYGARDWWPCKQDLNDKVELTDVYITAPIAYSSVANGLQQSRVENGSDATTHFRHNYPIPAYLVAIAVTNYQIFNQTAGTIATGTFPIVNYLYPEEFDVVSTGATTTNALTLTPAIINFFETKIGPYPYRNEKYGHARANLGGGMEHSTVSFMNSWGRSLISHELAHQWFGDKITCGTWKDIWLNEGITEYMSGLVRENFDVPTNPLAFTNWKAGKITSITNYTGSDSNLYLTDAQTNNVGRIFSSTITYNKGSMVTHMLRYKMGDINFFQGLRDYLAHPDHAYAYAITSQFQAKMEAVVLGSSLQEFFNDWVYGKGYPTYTISATSGSNPTQVAIQINQIQSDASVSYFEMPVTVRLTGAGALFQDFVLNNTSNGQIFNVTASFPVTGIVFDPNKDIISNTLNNTTTLGVTKFDFAKSINIYPNPASETLNIDLPNNLTLEKVSFYNNLGQLVLKSNNNKINVSGLSNGMYIVAFETSEGIFHKNFIKK